MHVYVYMYIYMCVFMYTHRFAHTELNSLETQRANFPLHSFIPMSFHIHCSVTRMKNSLHVAYSSEVNHCLTGRDKTMMTLSGRLEESLDSSLCSSELRGYRRAVCCKTTSQLQNEVLPLCHRYNLPLSRKNTICNCLQVFHCFSFLSCEGIMCYFSPC